MSRKKPQNASDDKFEEGRRRLEKIQKIFNKHYDERFQVESSVELIADVLHFCIISGGDRSLILEQARARHDQLTDEYIRYLIKYRLTH